MRKPNPKPMYFLIDGDEIHSYQSIDDMIEDRALESGEYQIIIGHEDLLTVEQKTIATLGSKPERKSRTRQTARGSVTTAGDVPKRSGRPKGSKNKPKVEAAPNPVVVANGKSEHVSEAQS